MQTKKDLKITKVTNSVELSELSWLDEHYAAERIVRTYTEDFMDTESGETVSVERNEIIFEKGRLLGPDDYSVLLFHFQSGDLKEVLLSNQQREGYVVDRGQFSLWLVKATGAKGKLNMLLRASNAKTAYEVASDYIELNFKGYFVIENVKTFDASVIIEPEKAKEPEGLSHKVEKCWYDVQIMVDDGEGEDVLTTGPYNYIVFADTVETAKSIIEAYISEDRAKSANITPFLVKMQEAKTINCNVIVPAEFCYAYVPKKEEEE